MDHDSPDAAECLKRRESIADVALVVDNQAGALDPSVSVHCLSLLPDAESQIRGDTLTAKEEPEHERARQAGWPGQAAGRSEPYRPSRDAHVLRSTSLSERRPPRREGHEHRLPAPESAEPKPKRRDREQD